MVLTFAGGVGVVLYLLLWAVSGEEDPSAPTTARTPPDVQRTVAFGLILLGVLLLLRLAGIWLGDALVWPVVVASAGAAVMWARGDEEDRARWIQLGARIPGNPVSAIFQGRTSAGRVIIGGALVGIGMAGFLAANDALVGIRPLLLWAIAALVGFSLLIGPWVWRLVHALSDERAERIRSETRAEVAAHLHDSVLQTLALIQRSADQPRRMVSLARRQERELRAWLYGERDALTTPGAMLVGAVDAIAADVEAAHDVMVETVVVGDLPVDAPTEALLKASREALVNAAKHAGVSTVSLFVEVEPDVVTAFVRDRGKGFVPTAVGDDRRGIADSIRGRLVRLGGRAEVVTAPGEGTEWTLTVPRPEAARPDHPRSDDARPDVQEDRT